MKATNRVPGAPEDHDSFRSELSGLIGIATLVELLCKYFKIESGTVEVASMRWTLRSERRLRLAKTCQCQDTTL